MKTFFKHLLIDYKMSVRDRTLFLMSYLFPLVFFFFMGTVMTSINPGFKEILFPSMILFTMLTSTVLIVPNVIVTNRENGIYRSYKIYGIKKASIVYLTYLSNLLNNIVVAIIIGLFSGLVFKVDMPKGFSEWLLFIVIGFMVWFTFITLAVLLGNLIKNSKHVVLYAQIIYLPSILLGGLMLDIRDLPENIRSLTYIFPTSHAMNMFNHWSYHREVLTNSFISMGVLIVFSLLFMFLDLKLFKYDYHN